MVKRFGSSLRMYTCRYDYNKYICPNELLSSFLRDTTGGDTDELMEIRMRIRMN